MLNSNMTKQISAEALWQFSLQLYPKVKAPCLQLQDELGANVNLLLLLCYLEQQQLSFTRTDLSQLSATLMSFSTAFTQPLRQLRRTADNAAIAPAMQHQLKQTLLQAELQLEQLEQQLLVQHCPALSSDAAPVLEHDLALLGFESSQYSKQLFTLRQAAAQLS
jgi:uncharacterized protein (TIGR02444 family)